MGVYTLTALASVVIVLALELLWWRTGILTTARYTRLTEQTKRHALDRINALMNGFSIQWGVLK